jgi:hypothetical protein
MRVVVGLYWSGAVLLAMANTLPCCIVMRVRHKLVTLRSAKRNRYGKEQFKIRYPTHYQYCLRLLTYTTNQTVDPQINADLPETPVTSTAATFGYNLEPERGTQTYFSLNPRVAAPNTNGLTSLNACGLYSLPIKRLILKSMPTCPRRR